MHVTPSLTHPRHTLTPHIQAAADSLAASFPPETGRERFESLDNCRDDWWRRRKDSSSFSRRNFSVSMRISSNSLLSAALLCSRISCRMIIPRNCPVTSCLSCRKSTTASGFPFVFEPLGSAGALLNMRVSSPKVISPLPSVSNEAKRESTAELLVP